MYATKRRRRSLKGGNNRSLSPQKNGEDGPVHLAHGHGHGGGQNNSGHGHGTSSLKSNPSKRHRERLNNELERLASLLPFESNILSKLDKLSILRLGVSYLRIKSYFQAIQLREHAYSSYDAPNGLPHQHVTKSTSDHFSLDPSLTRNDSLLKALNGFVLVLTTQGEVFYASNSIEEFLGFHQSDVIHQSVFELIHSEDRAELQKQLSTLSYAALQPGINQNDGTPFSSDAQLLERCLTVRFRCLLDNTSGFLRLEIRGRVSILHGQNVHSVGDNPLGLMAICTPIGPPTLPENVPKEAIFRSKLKLDLTVLNFDPKGKVLLGITSEESNTSSRSFYNISHPDDIRYLATAHRELVKTGSCVVYAHRISTKNGTPGPGITGSQAWQWLQTTMKAVPKNGKPDHVSASHRPLSDEEGKELLSKRGSITKLCDLDPEAVSGLSLGLSDKPNSTLFDHETSPNAKAKALKKRTSSTTSTRDTPINGVHSSTYLQNTPPRRRKSVSSDNPTLRNGAAIGQDYPSTNGYHTSHEVPPLPGYCPTTSFLDSRSYLFPTTAEHCTLLPYTTATASPYGSTAFYSPVPQSTVDGSNGHSDDRTGTYLDSTSGRSGYNIYAAAAAAAYNDSLVLPATGDYLKTYYRRMDPSFSVSNGFTTAAPMSYSTYPDFTSGSKTNSWINSSQHRQSVVVWNNNSRQADSLALKVSNWTDLRSHPTVGTASSSGSSSYSNGNDLQNRSHSVESQRLSSGANCTIPNGFSISETTNTLLESSG